MDSSIQRVASGPEILDIVDDSFQQEDSTNINITTMQDEDIAKQILAHKRIENTRS